MNKLAVNSLILASCLALIFGVLNPYHLLPGLDIFHSSFVAAILGMGLLGFFITKPVLYLPKSSWTWVSLFFLVLLQPLINTIFYPDALIFPLGNLLICILLSIAIASLKNPKKLIDYFIYTLIGCMLLSTVIQLLQFNNISIEDGLFIVMKMQGRFDGNFFQPNQLSFMTDLGLVAVLYLYYKNKEAGTDKTYVTGLLAIVFMIFSFSVGLTMSRGGLIMAIAAIIGYGIGYRQPLKQRILHTAAFFGLFGLGYYLAIWSYKYIYLANTPASMGGLDRVDSILIRGSLQQRALNLFESSPLTGVGWHNYSYNSINNATHIQWFTYSEHSHVIFTQIASELGILGLLALIPMLWLIIKKFSIKQTNFNAFLYVSIGVFFLYSLSEFPLWYLRFLYIFVIYTALLDDDRKLININFGKIFSIVGVIITALSLFYMLQFFKMFLIIKEIETGNISEAQKLQLYQSWSAPFGYSGFKESVLFSVLPVDEHQLNEKIVLGDRVLTVAISKKALFKQGQLLVLANNKDLALVKFKAACALDWDGNCDDVVGVLNEVSTAEPKVYGNIAKEFNKWVVTFDPRKNKI